MGEEVKSKKATIGMLSAIMAIDMMMSGQERRLDRPAYGRSRGSKNKARRKARKTRKGPQFRGWKG